LSDGLQAVQTALIALDAQTVEDVGGDDGTEHPVHEAKTSVVGHSLASYIFEVEWIQDQVQDL
jgi:hypothetical protein